jgi:hypothetical protein
MSGMSSRPCRVSALPRCFTSGWAQDLGTYSGILAASFCGAQFLSSIVIGKFSDV